MGKLLYIDTLQFDFVFLYNNLPLFRTSAKTYDVRATKMGKLLYIDTLHYNFVFLYNNLPLFRAPAEPVTSGQQLTLRKGNLLYKNTRYIFIDVEHILLFSGKKN